MPVSFSVEEYCGKYVDLHDLYREYSNLTFDFDNTTVNTTEANQGANPLALAAARHQSIDYTAFLLLCSLQPKNVTVHMCAHFGVRISLFAWAVELCHEDTSMQCGSEIHPLLGEKKIDPRRKNDPLAWGGGTTGGDPGTHGTRQPLESVDGFVLMVEFK